MKTIFRAAIIASTVVIAAACGSKTTKTDAPQVADLTPTVSVAEVYVREVPQTAVYTSTVQPYVKNNIAPQMTGRITKICAEIGDFVKKGQVLAEIDKASLQQAQLQLLNQEVELQRLRSLYEAGAISKSDLDAIELSYNVTKTQVENLLENTVLCSPIDGVVPARNYDVGDMYAMSSPIYTVEQIKPVKLLVAVSESDYTKVKKGDSVEVVADALPELKFYGKIEKIYPTVDSSTRTFNVEVVVANNYSSLRPGMFARVTIKFGSNNNVVIPDVAVVKQQGSGERFVYVLNEDGTVSYVKVVLGRRMGAEYEVLEGLSDSTTVVVGGQIRLKDGVKVSVSK